jgi:hypothetical protein
MRMEESHEHMSTPSAYDGVNGVTSASLNFIAIVPKFCASGSLSSFLIEFHRQLTSCSRRLESTISSFPILANPLQSSPSISWTESQRRSLSVAQWRSPIRMRNSYAHMTESAESLSASSFILLLQVLRELCESLRHRGFSLSPLS